MLKNDFHNIKINMESHGNRGLQESPGLTALTLARSLTFI